jgi:hypothetical protein
VNDFRSINARFRLCLDLVRAFRRKWREYFGGSTGNLRTGSPDTIKDRTPNEALDPGRSDDARITRFSPVFPDHTDASGPDPTEPTFAMTTISPYIFNNLHIHLHSPMPNSSWEQACPSARRVGVRRPVIFDN